MAFAFLFKKPPREGWRCPVSPFHIGPDVCLLFNAFLWAFLDGIGRIC